MSETAQVSSLRELLAEQAVRVFIDTTLPGAVRIGKVNFHTGGFSQALVFSYLLALIVRQRKALLRLDATEDVAEAAEYRLGNGILHPEQQSEQRRAFHQRPFFNAQLPIVSSHATFSPDNVALGF